MRIPGDFTRKWFDRFKPEPAGMFAWARLPAEMMTEAHDAWLDSLGGVSKAKYQKLLEENIQLRRRLEQSGQTPPTVEAAAEAMDEAFDQLKTVQEQWLSMWLPRRPSTGAPK